ncbi:MAG TPA: hypothetical protein VE178_15215 [Silvibacterium sp.]|nr:hypothetical protein [Silvibacterium sp.]
MQQLCRHILSGNTHCRAIALTGKRFCRHHYKLHDWQRRCGLRSQIRPQTLTQTPTQTYDHGTILVPEPSVYPAPQIHPPLELEFPEDRTAIQINLYRVADYLARGLMERSDATALMYAMQVCQTNLGKRPLLEAAPAATPPRSRSQDADSDDSDSTTYTDPGCPTSGHSDVSSRPVHRVILTPEGDEIAPPVEILEDNEAEPIHHTGCPCLLCAEKYRNQPPEEHHPACQCGLCEDQITELSTQSSASSMNCHPERTLSEAKGASKDLLLPETGSELCALSPRKRVARASSLLSGSASRDPLNRPWSVAEYTFGDAIRRHEAQYAARAAAALAVGIEPPPYEPFMTGLHAPGTPEREEDEQMQQHSREYWAEHFRKQIAERVEEHSDIKQSDERAFSA